MVHGTVLFQWVLVVLVLKRGESCGGKDWIQNDGNCYKIFTERANKSVAETTCLELKSALASISNVEEHTFLVTQLNQANTSEENFWIGLHKIGNLLIWNNRAPAGNLPWVDDSSSPTRESKDCFIFNSAKVLPLDCSAEASFVCEQWKVPDISPSPTCPPEAHNDFISDKCFWYTHMPLSKAGSEVICSLKYGRLLVPGGAFFPLNIAMIITMLPPPSPIVLWTSLAIRNGSVVFEDGTDYNRDDFMIRRGDGDCIALVVDGRTAQFELHQKSCLEEALGFCEIKTDFLKQEFHEIFGTINSEDANSTASELKCPEGNGWQDHEETGYCYWKTPSETTTLFSWEDARKYCQSYGGDLASFHSIQEERIGLGFRNGSVEHSHWIGLYHDLDSDNYVWADGTPMDHTNWDDGQPNHQDRRFRCGYISAVNKKWSMIYCGSLHGFVCKAPKQINPRKALPPTSEPLVKCANSTSEYFFNGYCYQKMVLLYGWHRAQQHCENLGRNLVSLHSEDEVNFIIKYLAASRPHKGNRLWIGLNTLSLDGAFQWTDGTPVDFTNWDTDEPNNFQNQEKCSNMYFEHGMWNDENCNSIMNFICKRRNGTLPGGTTTTTTPAPVRGYCKQDWYMFGDKCFLPVGMKKPQRRNWTEAGMHCLSLGGTLASVGNARDQAFMYYLIQSLKTDTWIGLHDSIHSGVFFWVDNSPLFYTNWAQGEPSSFGFEEDCVVISYGRTDGGRWKDTNCHRELPYICQTHRDSTIMIPSSVRGTRCPHPPGYTKQGLSCYKVFTDPSSWEEARANCAIDHGHLVSIHNLEVQAVVKYLAALSSNDNDTFWIGLQYKGKYPLQWANGWPMVFSRWGRNEPKQLRGQNTCFYVTLSGFWRSAPCYEKRPFICHVTADVPPTPAVTVKGSCPTGTTSRWTEVGNSCFLFGLRWSIEWYSASYRCFLEGAHLASFHSMETLNNVRYYLQDTTKQSLFIGLTKNSEGGFQWADGSPVDFVNWDEDEPRNTDQQCVAMRVDTMKWSVVACDTRKYYLCAKEKENMFHPTSLPFASTPDNTSRGQGTSSGVHPGIVTAIIISIIVLAIAAVLILLRVRPWKNEWNRYSVHTSEQTTSFANDTYSIDFNDLNHVDFHDKDVLFVKD